MKPTIKEFLGKVEYDDYGQMIFAEGKYTKNLILNVRGWGAIQYLFPTFKEAKDFQNQIGEFIAEAINEKIERL